MNLESKELESLFFNTTDFKLRNQAIGEGTFGKVYMATQIKDNQRYAVKILKTEGGFNGHSQMLFMRESLILQKLKHPCIVEFKGINFQSFTDPSLLSPSIITEYLSHGSLKVILDNEKKSRADINWSPTKKYINLLGIARAMKYLHSHGVIHRDLKPENILTDENYYPHVCDFGLSRFFAQSISNSQKLTMTGQIGTPLYMAPELLEGEEHYGPGVDVYAFSMLAFEIVTCEVPFKELGNISPFSLGVKVTSGYRPRIPKGVTSKMASLLKRCWSQKAEERPSFDEIYEELSGDFSMLGEDVDEEEILDFIEMLDEQEQQKEAVSNTSNKELENELKKLKKIIRENEERYQEEIRKLNESSQLSRDYFARGVCRLLSNNDEKNVLEGLQYLKFSSNEGNSHASFICGLLYENGQGIEKDFSKCIHYYKRSSSQGNTYGLVRIGLCYNFGFAVKQDYKKAIEYYQNGIELGNSYAMLFLGLRYKNGEGVKKDYSKAFEFCKKGSELGNLDAINWIGNFYENGIGVEKNYSKMFECYEKVAKLGDGCGLKKLGICYEKGLGVKKDYSKAIEYYEKSSKVGFEDAKILLRNLKKRI